MKLRATSKRLLVQRIEPEKVTDAGIILRSTEEHPQARVIDIGPKVDVTVVLGQRCMVDWSRVGHIKFEDQDYYIVEQSNVMAVFD